MLYLLKNCLVGTALKIQNIYVISRFSLQFFQTNALISLISKCREKTTPYPVHNAFQMKLSVPSYEIMLFSIISSVPPSFFKVPDSFWNIIECSLCQLWWEITIINLKKFSVTKQYAFLKLFPTFFDIYYKKVNHNLKSE